MMKTDVVVIGAGAVGCAIARAGRIAPVALNGTCRSSTSFGNIGFAATTSCDSSVPGEASYPV